MMGSDSVLVQSKLVIQDQAHPSELKMMNNKYNRLVEKNVFSQSLLDNVALIDSFRKEGNPIHKGVEEFIGFDEVSLEREFVLKISAETQREYSLKAYQLAKEDRSALDVYRNLREAYNKRSATIAAERKQEKRRILAEIRKRNQRFEKNRLQNLPQKGIQPNFTNYNSSFQPISRKSSL